MPSILSFINPYWNTPVPAVLFTAILSLAYLLLSDNIYTLINYVQIVNWLAIGVATAGLMWMRFFFDIFFLKIKKIKLLLCIFIIL